MMKLAMALKPNQSSCSTNHARPKSTSALKQQPSLRRDKQKVVNNENGLNASPEFKSFVAKKLSDALDR